jgi:hypothetical protein
MTTAGCDGDAGAYPHNAVDTANQSECTFSDRPAEPQPELNEVAVADGAVGVEVEDGVHAAEGLAKDDEVETR